MWASSQGRVDTVAILLEAGADVNAVDEDGVSALMWASGSEVCTLYLIYLCSYQGWIILNEHRP
jgi:hypothetical protein